MNQYCPDSPIKISNETSENAHLLIVDAEAIQLTEVTNPNDLPILLFAFSFKPFLIQYTNKLDVNGVFTLEMDPNNIARSVTGAVNGDIYYDENMISMLFSNSTNDTASKVAALTTREMEIVVMMMNDMTNEEIATHFDVSIRTVNAHKGNIMRKLEVKTSCGLVKMLLEFAPAFRSQF